MAWLVAIAGTLGVLTLVGCRTPESESAKARPAPAPALTNTPPPAVTTSTTDRPVKLARRYTYTPKVYPVDERGFSPVDKALASAYAREELVADDDEGSLNPY